MDQILKRHSKAHGPAELTFDIETLPTNLTKIIEYLSKKVKPPGNLKRKEAIEEWMQYEKPKAVDEVVARTALDGSYGRVCSIAWKLNDLPAVATVGEEVEVITQFLSILDQMPKERLVLVGHNILGFDLRFLWQRMIINGIQPPKYIDWRATRISHGLQDTMQIWNPERDRRISLDNLCTILQVESHKDEFDGSMVYAAWVKGEYEKIRTHTRNDVESTYACYKKIVQR